MCLLIEVYGLECDFIFPQMHCCGGHVRVVTENDDPVFLNNGLQPFSLGFERLQRIKVIRHDPRGRQVVASGKKIGDEENGFTSAGEFDGLNVGVVSGNADGGNAGEDFGIAVVGGLGEGANGERVFDLVTGGIDFGDFAVADEPRAECNFPPVRLASEPPAPIIENATPRRK